jgi:hypothetical protein
MKFLLSYQSFTRILNYQINKFFHKNYLKFYYLVKNYITLIGVLKARLSKAEVIAIPAEGPSLGVAEVIKN